ncbi:MAG: hypothetical protein LBR73_07675 [Oscillospiraceae bacterium]|jgi:hypothetical protein|nr:hypothetical protein [Oscillospiraceae bacterium]
MERFLGYLLSFIIYVSNFLFASFATPEQIIHSATDYVNRIPLINMTRWEVDAASVESPAEGARVIRAWKAERGGVKVDAYRLAVGEPHTVIGTDASYHPDPTRTAIAQPVLALEIIECAPERLHSRTSQQILGAAGKNGGRINLMANMSGAIAAMSGVYFYGSGTKNELTFVSTCPIVREGVVVSDRGGTQNVLNIYTDGRWVWESQNAANVQAHIDDGLSFTVADMMVPYHNGQYWSDLGEEGWNDTGTEPYSFMAQIDATHYMFAVGEYMPHDLIVDVLISAGAKTIVEADGGNHGYLFLEGVGNSVHPAALHSLANFVNSKINMLDNEYQYLLGIYAGEGKGAAMKEIDLFYIS